MRIRLRYRLLLPLIGLLSVQAVATTWVVQSAAATVDSQIEEQLQTVNRTLLEPPAFPLTGRVLQQMKGLSGAEFLLTLPDGRTITTFQPEPRISLDSTSAEVLIDTKLYRSKTLRFPESHPNYGGLLDIYYPEAQRQDAVRKAVQPLLLLGIFGAFLSVMFVFLLARQVTGRIGQLQQKTRNIAEGAFQPIPISGPDDELRDLANSINEMAEQLAEQRAKLGETERLRVLAQFSGGLAHQLRNAAAGAKLAIQLHLVEHPTADTEALHVALRQLARMESNLQQFLGLGKPPSLRKQLFDLAELCRQCAELVGPQCQHTDTDLRLRVPDKLTFEGEATALQHLVGNLLNNAIEASGPGGEVELVLEEQSESITLMVRDNGPGPPEAIASQLFEPFITGREQGIGLGLAVAKQAVDNHGGSIRWSRDEGWTTFYVEIPNTNQEADGSFWAAPGG
jgi:signal transduction histidine kinase